MSVLDVLNKLVELERVRRPWTDDDESGKPFFVFCIDELAKAQRGSTSRARVKAIIDQFLRKGYDLLQTPKFVLFSSLDGYLWAHVVGGMKKDKTTGEVDFQIKGRSSWQWLQLSPVVSRVVFEQLKAVTKLPDDQLEVVIAYCCGHPRTLSLLRDVLRRDPTKPANDILKELKSQMDEYLSKLGEAD
jgi:hypothetical protein